MNAGELAPSWRVLALRQAAHAALWPALWSTELVGLAVARWPSGGLLRAAVVSACTAVHLRCCQLALWLLTRADRMHRREQWH